MAFNRKLNLFEKILLPIAFIVGILGFYMLFSAQQSGAWLETIAVFLWLILIFLMIIAATNEDVKEELSLIVKDQIDETRIIKELNHDLVSEIKLMRQEMKRK